MDQVTATAQLAAVTLPVGYTGGVQAADAGLYFARVTAPDGWVCDWGEAGLTSWAQAQINAHTGV